MCCMWTAVSISLACKWGRKKTVTSNPATQTMVSWTLTHAECADFKLRFRLHQRHLPFYGKIGAYV
jgi:hypothetical protein